MFDCLSVKSGSSQVCSLYGGQPLTAESGFLSSVTTLETGVGLGSCPWMIDGSRGQRVNITLSSYIGVHYVSTVENVESACRRRGWTIVITEYNTTVSTV